jgi:hypothetical protein
MVQLVTIILFSAVKFAMTFPLAVMQFQFSFTETILWTSVAWSVIFTVLYMFWDGVLFRRG